MSTAVSKQTFTSKENCTFTSTTRWFPESATSTSHSDHDAAQMPLGKLNCGASNSVEDDPGVPTNDSSLPCRIVEYSSKLNLALQRHALQQCHGDTRTLTVTHWWKG